MTTLKFFPNDSAVVFATIDADHPPKEADFYRFAPTADMTSREIGDIKAYLESLKPGSVAKVLPRERKRKTVSKKAAKSQKAKSPRDTVLELVELRSKTSIDKTALKAECQDRMDECNV